MLIDNHNREINYMRLAVTDRCNLRCFYCMPENGIQFMNKKKLLSFEEMLRLIDVFGKLGIRKVRITGGEPFVRKGIGEFMEELSKNPYLDEINVTTNGTFTHDKVELMERIGIKTVNLSLDTLDPTRFFEITRRDMFEQVMKSFEALVQSSIRTKINMVVMEGRNIEDILPMVELTRAKDIDVRFIEEMPFNGTPGQGNATYWPQKKILDHIRSDFELEKIPDPVSSTSANYRVPGFAGTVGIIAAYTRTFCGSCNRIRMTPQGTLRTCLYGQGQLSFRDMIRNGATDQQLGDALVATLQKRAVNGFEAEKLRDQATPVSESMATVGG